MPETESLLAFLGHVRRRHITTQLVRHGITALVFGLSGLILLLLAGTQIFDWYWPALLFATAFGFGAWRFLSQLPTPYRLAQMVDRRLSLHDALSTAFHFVSTSGGLVHAQREQAGRLSATLSVESAAPLIWPKTSYAAASLALAALTLIGIRYGILNTLDLSAPVSEGMIDVFRFAGVNGKKQIAGQKAPQLPDDLKNNGLTIDQDLKDELNKIEKAKEGEITTSDIPDVNDLSEAARGEKGKSSVEGKGVNPGEGEKGGEGNQDSENADPNDSPKQGKNEDGKNQNAKDAKQGSKSGDNNMASNKNSSMMDKMKDAFANMMNKMKMPNQADQKQASNQKPGEKGGQQQGGEKGGKQPGKGNEAQAGEEQPGDDSQQSADQQANAKGQGGDKSANMQAPPDAKSGVGKADGDKSIKDALQQQAMGKISEILGKRAKDISGEVMVEVNGGKQQLRTQYSNSAAQHAESGGDIHRDEVPLQHQQYVQQYFEEVRKQSAAAKK